MWKRCTTPYATRELEIKTKMKCNIDTQTWRQIKVLSMWSHGEDVERCKLSSAAGKNGKWGPGGRQSGRRLPHKCEDLILESQHPHKSQAQLSVSVIPLLGG